MKFPDDIFLAHTANPANSATYPPLRERPQSGADIPVCARPRGQTGMSAPHYHAPSLRLALHVPHKMPYNNHDYGDPPLPIQKPMRKPLM